MRVAFVFNHANFLGGGEISLAELIRVVDREHIEPFVIVPSRDEIMNLFEKSGTHVLATPFPPLRANFLHGFLWALFRFTRNLRELKPDIIHANGSRVCLYSVLAGRILGIPVLWHVRETIKDLFFYDRLLFGLSSAIVCVSESVKIKRFNSFPRRWKAKIRVIYNGVDTNVFRLNATAREKTRKELGIKENEILFGTVANYVPHKGQHFFLAGMAELGRSDPSLAFKVLLIGRPLYPAFYDRLRSIASERALQDRVIFLEHTDRIADIYSALDVFVLLSRREGFSRSILEAMSMGLPVLATRLQEIQEAVDDGHNGLLVKQDDLQGLCEAALKLAKGKLLREEMRALNRKKAESEFSLLAHARSMEKVYSRILGIPICGTK